MEVRNKMSKAKKKNKTPKSGSVWHLSADEATLASKPLYNGYACGYGAHGHRGYDRRAENKKLHGELHDENL